MTPTEQLQETVKRLFPDAILITRKPTNHEARVIDEEGREIVQASSNKALLEMLEEQGASIRKRVNSRFGVTEAAQNTIPGERRMEMVKQLSVYIVNHLIEIQELTRGKPPVVDTIDITANDNNGHAFLFQVKVDGHTFGA